MAAKALLFFCKKEEGLMPLVLTPRASPAAPFRGAFAPSGRGHLGVCFFQQGEGLMPLVCGEWLY